MSTILIWVVTAILLFALFILSMIGGIVRKSLPLVIVAVFSFVLCFGAGAIAFLNFATKSYDVITSATTDRTGEQIYIAEFGPATTKCVQIIDYFEPIAPQIENKLMICFKTCPQEVSRILSKYQYDVIQKETSQIQSAVTDKCCSQFVNEQRFGNVVLECLASSQSNNYTVYVTLDSTRVYYIKEMK